MPLRQNSPQFKAALTQADVPPVVQRPLSYVRSTEVRSLYWKHRGLQLLISLWFVLGIGGLAFGIAALLGKIPPQFNPNLDVPFYGACALAYGLIFPITSLGCWLRAEWGRFAGVVTSLLALPVFPYGSALGLFGLFVCLISNPLFGEKRVNGGELVEEHRFRRVLDR